MPDNEITRKQAFLDWLKGIYRGMAESGMPQYAIRTRGNMERLFIVITLGDLLGVPMLPPYYRLRLLPYFLPQIEGWKRSMLREKDMNDALD